MNFHFNLEKILKAIIAASVVFFMCYQSYKIYSLKAMIKELRNECAITVDEYFERYVK